MKGAETQPWARFHRIIHCIEGRHKVCFCGKDDTGSNQGVNSKATNITSATTFKKEETERKSKWVSLLTSTKI